jgi:carbon-monoxide dehydrogenase medium subunit
VKPVDFDLHRPTSVSEAVGLLASHEDEAKVLAGGQSLVPLLNFRLAAPSHVIDIGRLPLTGVSFCDGSVTVGALTRQAALPGLAGPCPLIAAAVPWIAHPPIRARGTLGGSLAHADPAAELPAVAAALDATFSLADGRSIPAASFFQGYLTTALSSLDLLVAISFPVAPAGTGACFEEVARRRGDFALVGCAAQVTVFDEALTDVRICLSGVAPIPFRCRASEDLLRGAAVPLGATLLGEAADAAVAELSPPSDLHASGDYRRHLAHVLIRRAVQRAATQAAALSVPDAPPDGVPDAPPDGVPDAPPDGVPDLSAYSTQENLRSRSVRPQARPGINRGLAAPLHAPRRSRQSQAGITGRIRVRPCTRILPVIASRPLAGQGDGTLRTNWLSQNSTNLA